MTGAPQRSPHEVAIARDLMLLGRYRPCPHSEPDTRIGDGRTWARCNDCGQTLKQGRLPIARESTAAFDEAHERVEQRFARAAGAAEALRLLLLSASIDDGTTGCVAGAARALADFDAAMR